MRRWLRRAGLEPLAIDGGFPEHRARGLDLTDAGLHALTALHPAGPDADTADAVIDAAGRLLRPHGILLLTVPLGPSSLGGLDLAGVGVGRQVGGVGAELQVERGVRGHGHQLGLGDAAAEALGGTGDDGDLVRQLGVCRQLRHQRRLPVSPPSRV